MANKPHYITFTTLIPAYKQKELETAIERMKDATGLSLSSYIYSALEDKLIQDGYLSADSVPSVQVSPPKKTDKAFCPDITEELFLWINEQAQQAKITMSHFAKVCIVYAIGKDLNIQERDEKRTKKINLRLSPDLCQQIDEYRGRLSAAEYIRRCLIFCKSVELSELLNPQS